jgi:hypothetical protein
MKQPQKPRNFGQEAASGVEAGQGQGQGRERAKNGMEAL